LIFLQYKDTIFFKKANSKFTITSKTNQI